MKFNFLFKREEFDFIFVKTVESYLKSQFYWSGKINIGNQFRTHNSFLLNSFLNIIFPSNISESSLKLIIDEHLYDKSFLKLILRRIFLKLSILKFTRIFLSSRIITFTNYEKRFDDLIFLGGNNTIKILDLRNKHCIVLKKYGFIPNFFNNALNTRTLYSSIINNTIIEYNKKEYWIKEQLLEGIPLDRQKNDLYSEEALIIAKEKMKLIYKVSKKYSKFKPYLSNLVRQINNEINNLNKNYKNKFRISLLKLVDTIRKYLIQENYQELNLLIAVSHGDFNKGNIVLSRSNNYISIIDWEYSYERVIWYDSFYLELNASNPNGISKRINNLKKYNDFDFQNLFWVEIQEKLSFKRDFYIKAFLLESLLNRLIQCNASCNIKKDNGLYIYFNEIKNIYNSNYEFQ